MKSATLVDVVQDESGYAVQFADGYTLCVEQYDDLSTHALDTLERHGNDVLRAALILRWVDSSAINKSIVVSGSGEVNIIG